ncbi:MAG: tetratricopeptide repeat protein [candidate division Zixibacteria bacterium]
MKRSIIGICGLCIYILIFSGLIQARNIQCEITVREQNSDGDYVLIYKKNIDVYEGIKNTSFHVNFTIDLTANSRGDSLYECEFSLYTLGPQPQNLFKKFHSHAGGIYFVEDVRGKNNTVYRVGISPLAIDSVSDIDQTCDYDYHADGVWNFDPSANFDFYYVPRTLGDVRWNLLREYVETTYKEFKKIFEQGFPGKVNYFFAPCLLKEVQWDKRGGFAIDPTRSNCFTLYSHNYNTIDAFPGILTRTYRYLGYSPPILVEGAAGYFDAAHYYARELKKKSELSPLANMLRSIDYFRLPGYNNVSAAASFVKYLVDKYGLNRFIELYRKATDLNIGEQFSVVYDISLDSLEADWHHLLDTVTIHSGHFHYFYERDKFIYNRTGMDIFLRELKNHMETTYDSTYAIGEEAWNMYMDGEYDTARTLYEFLITREADDITNWMAYGNLLLIDGQYDSALKIYDRVYETDSTAKSMFYKKGDTYFRMANIDSAKTYLIRDFTENPSQLSRASSGILMGRISLSEGDTATAIDYYAGAVDAVEQIYQMGKSRPAYLLRLGQAHLGLALCENDTTSVAKSYLDQGLYFEVHPVRVIFFTRLLRELGRIADLDGRREDAIALYQRVLKYPLPPHFEEEVRSYILEPFRGF